MRTRHTNPGQAWASESSSTSASGRPGWLRPDKDRESKTWLSEDTGPITSIEQLLGQAARFELKPDQSKQVLAEVVKAVAQWKSVALTPEVGLTSAELDDFAPAFEHASLEEAKVLAAR